MYERKLSVQSQPRTESAARVSSTIARTRSGIAQDSQEDFASSIEERANPTDSPPWQPAVRIPPRPASPAPPSVPAGRRATPKPGLRSERFACGPTGASLEERTLAYDQRELSRLVQETERESDIPGLEGVPEGDESFYDSTQPSIGELPIPKATPNHPADDDVTTAYVSPRYRPSLGDVHARETVVNESAEVSPTRIEVAPLSNPASSRQAASQFTPLIQGERTSLALRHKKRATRKRNKEGSRVGLWLTGFVLIAASAWLMTASLGHGPGAATLRVAWGRLNQSATNAGAPRAANSELIELDIVVDPPGAKLYLDGRETSNPLKVAYPSDSLSHELRGVADGFQTRSQPVRFDRNLVIQLRLAPLRSSAPVAAR